MEHDAKESVRQVPDSPFVLALFESFPEQANLKGRGEKLVGQPLGACPGTRRRDRKDRRKQALRRAAPCPGRVGSGEPSRPAQTQQTHRRAGGNARWRDSGHRKTSVLRMTSGSDVLRRECPPEAAAGKRRRTTASAPGRMARGTNAGGGAEPHGGSRTDTGGCGGNVRRKPRPANGAARPHPHRDAWRGARMRGGAEPHGGSRTPEAAAGKSAGSRSRQTAPHDPIRTGTHGAGDECGGGLNRTAAPGIGGGPHAPTALRTTTVGITDRRGDT